MWEAGGGRENLCAGGDAFRPGTLVTLVTKPEERGAVISVDGDNVAVQWTGGSFPVVYAAYMIRRLFPWE